MITFAHELCGHAALFELKAHPPSASASSRETFDERDPAIRIERGLWLEQGLKASEKRALAREGKNRGESFTRSGSRSAALT